jgi:hypothetical protein
MMSMMTMTIKADEINIINETYLCLTGRWLTSRIWVAQGFKHKERATPASVSFEEDAYGIISREISYGDVIGFYHTHPNMPAFVSTTDFTTMNAWVDALGKPLICLIEGKDGLYTYYWRGDGIYNEAKSIKIGNFFMGVICKE